jgi:hypothetical protein
MYLNERAWEYMYLIYLVLARHQWEYHYNAPGLHKFLATQEGIYTMLLILAA